jgi:Xaa-Pro aminopeptidase
MTPDVAHARQRSRAARRERLAALMERHGLGALLLRRPANFAWYTGGADNRVNHASPLGAADVLVTPDAEYVVTSTIEAPRMRDEQTPDIPVVEYPWYGDVWPALREVIGGARLGADCPLPGAADVEDAIDPLRYVLDAEAIARYRQVGADAALALAEALDGLAPGMSEREAAARIKAACERRALACPVALAASDDRIARYRHPIPHDRLIKQRLMLVCCAERGGLYANLTRILDFTPPDDELRRRMDACDSMLRRLREATRPGRTLAEMFADCQRFYAEAGFPHEWKLHHQGGLTGYASREVLATPEATHITVQVGHAFAWNPSVAGAKAEETFILTEAGPEVI